MKLLTKGFLLLSLLLMLNAADARTRKPIVQSDAQSYPLSTLTLPKVGETATQTAVTQTVQPVSGTSTGSGYDYSTNLSSNVFGAQLFAGNFARTGPVQFSPDYAISAGDQIQLRFWGGFEYESILTVDPKGNIFLPHVGPVQVLGVRNEDLQRVVEGAAARVFRANVFSYANLAAAQPVRIYVGGFVNRPGLFNGTSLDSLLHYLDQAGGIDPERGSFLNVTVKRGDTVRARINLYDFLLNGTMPMVQFADGDVIFVAPRQHSALVIGLAQNAKRFEFESDSVPASELIQLAKPFAEATHVRVTRNHGSVKNTDYYALDSVDAVSIQDGDELAFTSDKKPGTITVRVEGEHESAQEYVLPYGTRLGTLVDQIQFSERSDKGGIQLFRLSVKERQREMLRTALNNLETVALTARSGTSDEAQLRKDEANLLLQWVDRAKKIEPLGQVMIAGSDRSELLLENGDVLRVPTLDGLVLVGGEVLFPNAIAFKDGLTLLEYVNGAGGYTQNADSSRVVIAHRDGSFAQKSDERGLFHRAEQEVVIRPGDQILVLPKIDVKSRQIWKDMTQIIYQIAVSARVATHF